MSFKENNKRNSSVSVSEELEIKMAVLGKSLVGKSALTYRFISNKFPTEHDTTIEDQYKVSKVIDSVKCRLEILDTAGQDDYQSMLDSWIAFSEGFILVYAIDDVESFDTVKRKYDRIIKTKTIDSYSVIIVGNKCDLENKRKVSKDEAQAYCKSIGVEFLEVSSLQKINVTETFLIVAQEIVKKKMKNNSKPQSFVCCVSF